MDCFSGPWNVKAEDLSDSSFAIALQELRKAREGLRAKRPNLQIRCYFIEKDRDAYEQLDAFAKSVADAEIATNNAKLENAVPAIMDFVNRGGPNSFPFFLIDPTGWTGFELDVIEPLLKQRPGEVLVNLMTSFIRRFIKSPDPETRRSFDRTFGRYGPAVEEIRNLSEEDLDDAIVGAYSKLVRETGGYSYVCNAIVLHPDIDSTHFRLIYGTRSPKGIEVFKKAEKAAMPLQENLRATVSEKKKADMGQLPLYSPELIGASKHYHELRRRYRSLAKEAVAKLINASSNLQYDKVYGSALQYPVVWEPDLNGWIAEWSKAKYIELIGLKPGKRVPGHSQRIQVRRLNSIPVK